jgi:CDP-diglyceride synthetase
VSGVIGFLHVRFALALVVLAIVLGLWGTYEYLRRRALSGGFRSTYLLMAGLTFVQGAAGVGELLLGNRPQNLLHIVYGIFAGAFLPGIYFYVGRGQKDREAVFLAAACWIVVIAFLRGFATGH